MHECDVLIVGGGPAGSSCAWGLRRSGLSVSILDKQDFPRDKVCGGWITPGVLAELEINPAEYAQGRLLQPITSFRIGCVGGSAVETDFGRPVSYGIRRREFDDYLLRRAGAQLVLGAPLASLERAGKGWIANDRLTARVVVGAGGHFCPVARLAGAAVNREDAVVAQEAEFEMDDRQLANCRVGREKPELYFCPDMKGYGWCFRKGNFLNVGLGRADAHGLSAHAAGFLEFLKSAGRISFEIPKLRGHAYLLNGVSRRPSTADAMLLAGDSAGLAHPQSGEGILPAIQSGLLAAKTILAARGAYGQKALASYREGIAAPAESWAMSAVRRLPPRWIALAARNLLQTKWFVNEIVLKEWFLHAPLELRRHLPHPTV